MYLSFVTGNILEKFQNKNYNIIYYPQNNLFDHILYAMDDYRYYLLNNNKIDYGINNVTDLPEEYFKLYQYNLSMTNNIIGYSTSNFTRFHLNTIIFTHSAKPHFIKKEDCSILSNNLSREIKVFFDDYSLSTWNLKSNTYSIPYGVHPLFTCDTPHEERKDVLIINFDQSIYANQLAEIIRQQNYHCDIIDSCMMTSQAIKQKYNEYKLCIELSDHNIINLLNAIACGCYGLTLRSLMIHNSYSNISGLYSVSTPNDIIEAIPRILETSIPANDISASIKERFNFDTFKQNIQKLANKANTEAFIL